MGVRRVIGYLECYKSLLYASILLTFSLQDVTDAEYLISSSFITSKSILEAPSNFLCAWS